MAIADYYPLVQKFYIAYFGRPADANGLQNMATQLNDAGDLLPEISNKAE